MTNLHTKLQECFPNAITDIHVQCGDETAYVKRENLFEVAQFLKTNIDFEMNVLMDLTAVDGLWLDWSPRFEMVYHFYSLRYNHRLRIKVKVGETDPVVASLVSLWPIANWLEREVWHMFGIQFEGHPNLKRLLMYEEFVGHPLRKDYPIAKRQPLIGPKN